MVVSDIKVVETAQGCELQARVKFDTHWVWGDEPFLLWYRYPAEMEDYLRADNGDPLLAACLAPAMLLNEPLEIPFPVSPALLQSIDEIQAIYKCWNPKLSLVQVRVPIRSQSASPTGSPQSKGLFFSLGVDSSYSLAKNLLKHPQDTESFSHLLTVLGFDIYLWESARFSSMLSNVQSVAGELDKRVMAVATNLRELTDRIVDWVSLYHGAALASVGLALDGRFRKCSIAATHTYAKLRPLGSHPILDPLWSTESLAFVHDGCEAGRLEKMRFLARFPSLLRCLRVCATSEVTDAYNCGRCPKCLMTIVGLHIAGALQHCETLPHIVDTGCLRSIQIRNTTQRVYLEQLLTALGSSATDLAIKSAIEECLARKSIVNS